MNLYNFMYYRIITIEALRMMLYCENYNFTYYIQKTFVGNFSFIYWRKEYKISINKKALVSLSFKDEH
jgi:hypothetical protein